MADTPAEPQAKSGTFGFLGRKLGPLPVWAWAALAFGAYYWYTHYGPGAQQQAATAATPAKQQRPQVIIVTGKGSKGGQPGPAGPPGPGGPGGPAGPPGPRGRKRRNIRPPRNPPPLPPAPVPPLREPATAAAPMTAGDIYGAIPTASQNGSTYDSGYPTAAQLEGAYVPAG